MLVPLSDSTWVRYNEIIFVTKCRHDENAGLFRATTEKWIVRVRTWDCSEQFIFDYAFGTELDADDYIAELLQTVKMAHEA